MRDLERIIQIRTGKVNRAKAGEKSRKQKLDKAQDRLTEAREAIDAFSEEMRGLEAKLLDGVLKTEVRAADMMMIEKILKAASEHASKLVEEARVVEREIDTCRESLEEARSQRIALSRRLKNISEVDREMSDRARIQTVKTAGRKEQDAMEDAFMGGRAR